MRRVPWRFAALAGALLAVNAAGLFWFGAKGSRRARPKPKPNAFTVSALDPAGDADRAQRLSLHFDRPLASPVQTGRPLARELFTIDPAPPGHWEWGAPDRLDYMLDRPLPPGRTYSVAPAEDISRLAGKKYEGERNYLFQTRRLELKGANIEAADEEQITLWLQFNQRVDPGALLRNLKIRDLAAALPVAPALVANENGERFLIRVPRPRRRSSTLELTLDPELRGWGGERGLERGERHVFEVTRTFALLSSYPYSHEVGVKPRVRLNFSEPISWKAPLPPIRLAPRVEDLAVQNDDGHLILQGSFAYGTRYEATVPADTLSEKGERLGEAQTTYFVFTKPEGQIRFAARGGILSPYGNLLLDIKAINADRARLAARRLYANNLAYYARHGTMATFSRELPSREFPLALPPNSEQTIALDLKSFLNDPRGVYEVDLRMDDRYWSTDRAIVTITDIGLTAKVDAEGALVWATSIRHAKPAAGVKLTALSMANQALATAETDGEGLARLDVPAKHPDGKLWMIIAEQGRDMSYLIPQECGWQIEDLDRSGRAPGSVYDAMLYAERGVYRPGDTIHLTGIVREGSGAIPPSFPIEIAVARPDGREVASPVVIPDEAMQGMFHIEIPTAAHDRTGNYRLMARIPGEQQILGFADVKLEAFEPARMEVEQTPSAEFYGEGEPITVGVKARYLFGQPAAGMSARAFARFQQQDFRSRAYPDFSFGTREPSERPETAESLTVLATLDAAGQTSISLAAPQSIRKGFYSATIVASVTEEGGRTLSKQAAATVDTAGRHVGLRVEAGRFAPIGAPFAVKWVQRTGRDEPATPGSVRFLLRRIEYDSVYQTDDYGRGHWRSAENTVNISEQLLAAANLTGPEGEILLTCPGWGRYRLDATDITSGVTTTLRFHAANDAHDYERLELTRPERLEIIPERESYEPGETARLLVRSPVAGLMLIAVEGERALERRVIELNGTSAQVELPLTGGLRGGAFISASVVRAVDPAAENWLPHRSLGAARVKFAHTAQRLGVDLGAPAQTLPGRKLRLDVRTTAKAETGGAGVLHLWAVDEGILLVDGYKTPDPHARFFRAPGSAVENADLFGDLMSDTARPESIARIGGDGDETLYRSPVDDKGRPPAVVWRAAQPLGPDGSAAVEIDLPAIAGAVRIMAVAVQGDAYGSSEARVRLATPLLVEATWPRFLAPGDEAEVPVKLFNTTDKAAEVALSITTEGGVELSGAPAGAKLAPNETQTLWMKAKGGLPGRFGVKVAGQTLEGAMAGLAMESAAVFPVRPVAPLATAAKLERIEAGTPWRFEPPAQFMAAATKTTLEVSAAPTVQLRAAVERLIDYPYGCVEQTTSKLIAMLHAADLIELETPSAGRRAAIEEMIRAGIARLWAMHTPAGGLAYWPGDQTPTLWGSAYAAGFLADARKAGYKLEPGLLGELAAYLEASLSRGEPELDPNLKAAVCRALAGLDRPNHGWMARLAENAAMLDIGGRAALGRAWLEAGDRARAAALLAEDTLGIKVERKTSGRISSQIEQEAALLEFLLDFDPKHAWIAELVRRVEAERSGGYWGTTLENARAISALSRYQIAAPAPPVWSGTIKIGGEPRAQFEQSAGALLKLAALDKPVEIESQGTGAIYLSAVTRGLLVAGEFKNEDRQLEVRRRWTDASGAEADPMKLKVGDAVAVTITIRAPGLNSWSGLDNFVIVDALPGGMQAENPRLATSSAEQTAQEGLDRAEYLDDRVLLFCSVDSSPREFKYSLRAITAGKFALPPIQAECMYDPAYASLHGQGRVEIAR